MLRKIVHSTLACVVAAATLLSLGCGSSSHDNNLSPAQAQAISQEVVQAVIQAVSNGLGATPPAAKPAHRSLSTALGGMQPDQTSGCTPDASGETCNFPLSFTGPCPAGGTISVAGDIDGTLDNSGDGSINTKITVTPTNCSVSNVTFNGDPNISLDGQLGFTNTAPVFPITLTEGGGISYGPNPSGSCQLNVKYTINSLTSCTVTGTVCGQSVSGTC
jgi:hypothetical protein